MKALEKAFLEQLKEVRAKAVDTYASYADILDESVFSKLLDAFDKIKYSITDDAPKGLVFTCPDCGGHRLECCEDGPYVSEILNIDKEGDFDFGEINASGEVDRFQCLNCGYVLKEDDGRHGYNNIQEHLEVVEWIKKNCEQK